MPTFTYEARDRAGKKQAGTLSADTRQAATMALAQRGLKVQTIGLKAGRGEPGARTRAKSTDLLVFTRQLSTIVSAGLPLLQGLSILAEQTEDERFAAVINAVARDVEAGETFSDALRKYSRAFPDLYVSMVRAGEASGDLDGVLLQLADYIERTEELKRRIKSAMMYPVIAFGMIICIAAGLIVFVVPQFAEMFAGFGQELPLPTLLLLKASETLRSWSAVVIVVCLIGAVIGLRVWSGTEMGRYVVDSWKLRLPIFGKLLRKVAVSRFTRTLSTLTRSGVAILQALDIVQSTAGNAVFAKVVAQAGDSVRAGETLATPLERSGQFPGMVTRMIDVGEKTGALEQMLLKIADFYDSEVQAAVDGLTSLIEPILIMMMGVVVGGIVIALFMPMLKMASAVAGG